MKRGLALVLVLVLAIGLLAGCGTGKDSKKLKVGIVFDVGGRGDQSFNDSAYAGLERAQKEFGDKIEANFQEPDKTGSNRADLVRLLAQEKYDLIIGVGFLFSDDMGKIAKEFPNIKFAVVDGWLPSEPLEKNNMVALNFKEEEGSFLVGAAAALKSASGKIGFVGGMEGDLIRKFEMGFTAGAKYINKNIKVISNYIGTDGSAFANPAMGKELATAQIEQGADVIYHASGASGTGVITACAEKKVLAIGVDSDQSLTASAEQQPYILTSMLKRVDVSVYETIKAVVDGTFKGGYQVFDLKAGGVGYAMNDFNKTLMTSEITAKVDELAGKIKSGEIVVPAVKADLDAFIAGLK
ncbi:MAG: BMP family lipoprotein [Chloroflexota bacterium]